MRTCAMNSNASARRAGRIFIATGIVWIFVKVIIDRSNCTSCGTCSDTCPQLFEPNPNDTFSQIVEKFRLNGNIAEGLLTEESEACARDAVDLCPVSIIRMED
jgi:ferredoxin